MGRRSSFSHRPTPGTSTQGKRDAAGAAIAERVDWWRRQDEHATTDKERRALADALIVKFRRVSTTELAALLCARLTELGHAPARKEGRRAG
jgi:hypothetical protein